MSQINGLPVQQNQLAQMQIGYAQSGDPLNVPSPASMTAGKYGVFQQGVPRETVQSWVSPAAHIPITAAFTAPLKVTPSFHSEADMSLTRATESTARMNALDQHNMRNIAKGMVSAGGAWVGGGLGAVAGSPFGATMLGANIGSVAGMFAGSFDTVNAATEWLFEPSLRKRAHAMRLREVSESFVHGGQGVDASGRGMSATRAADLTNKLGGLASDSFNRTDVVNLTQMSAETGLLNMTMGNDQVVDQIKNVMKAVGKIVKMSGDPDLRKAIVQIAEARTMGLDINAATATIASAGALSRVAGVSTGQLMSQGGQMGAAIFQGAGLTGGTGLGAGMFAQAFTNAAVHSGSVTPQQLALMGGQQEASRQLMQGMAAAMTGTMGQTLLGAVVKGGADGLEIDTDALKKLSTAGPLDVQAAVRQASANLSPDKISQIHMQKAELLDKMSQELGPTGMMRLIGSVGQGVQKELGLKSLEQGLHVALGGQDPQLARFWSSALQNKGVWQTMIQQENLETRKGRMDEAAELDAIEDRGERRWRKTKNFVTLGLSRESLDFGMDITQAQEEEDTRNKAMGLGSTNISGVLGGEVGETALAQAYAFSAPGDRLRIRSSAGRLRPLHSSRGSSLFKGEDFGLGELASAADQLGTDTGMFENLTTGMKIERGLEKAAQLQQALRKGLEGNSVDAVARRQKLNDAFTPATLDNLRKRVKTTARYVYDDDSIRAGRGFKDFREQLTRNIHRLDSIGTPDLAKEIWAMDDDTLALLIEDAVSTSKDSEGVNIFRRALGQVTGAMDKARGTSVEDVFKYQKEDIEEEIAGFGATLMGSSRWFTTDKTEQDHARLFTAVTTDFNDSDMLALFFAHRSGDTVTADALEDKLHSEGKLGEYDDIAKGVSEKYAGDKEALETLGEGITAKIKQSATEPGGMGGAMEDLRRRGLNYQLVAKVTQVKTKIAELTKDASVLEMTDPEKILNVVRTNKGARKYLPAIKDKSGLEAISALSAAVEADGPITIDKGVHPTMGVPARDSDQTTSLRGAMGQFSGGASKIEKAATLFVAGAKAFARANGVTNFGAELDAASGVSTRTKQTGNGEAPMTFGEFVTASFIPQRYSQG